MNCPSCKTELETLHHIIYDCHTATEVGNILSLNNSNMNRLDTDHLLLHKWSLILHEEDPQKFWNDIILA